MILSESPGSNLLYLLFGRFSSFRLLKTMGASRFVNANRLVGCTAHFTSFLLLQQALGSELTNCSREHFPASFNRVAASKASSFKMILESCRASESGNFCNYSVGPHIRTVLSFSKSDSGACHITFMLGHLFDRVAISNLAYISILTLESRAEHGEVERSVEMLLNPIDRQRSSNRIEIRRLSLVLVSDITAGVWLVVETGRN